MAEKINQEDVFNPLDNFNEVDIRDSDKEDVLLSFQDVMFERCFVGEVPFKTILESLEMQFNDYINLEDKTNYVDIFYNQLENSYKYVEEDLDMDMDEYNDIFNQIRQEFYDFIYNQFQQRLTLTITGLESEAYDQDRIDYIIRKIYKYFILDGRKNFFNLITNDISNKINTVRLSDDDFQELVESLLTQYSPIVKSIGPLEFLRNTNGEEIAELLENNEISGNFLRKYTCKLYKNKDFEVDIINEIILRETNDKEND